MRKLRNCFFLLLLPAAGISTPAASLSAADIYNITTLAGNGTAGFSGYGGPATTNTGGMLSMRPRAVEFNASNGEAVWNGDGSAAGVYLAVAGSKKSKVVLVK